MKTRKPRRLSPAEEALWRKAMEQTSRMSGAQTLHEPIGQKPAKKVSNKAKQAAIQPFEIGSSVPARATQSAMRTDQPPAMDHKAWRKMKGGKLAPEARLDLHGHTLAQAQPRLTGFIMQSVGNGHRLVLVITGKGRGDLNGSPFPVRQGALRRAVPHWLQSPPLRSLILQVTEAHRRHGGEGALYVYLRRNR